MTTPTPVRASSPSPNPQPSNVSNPAQPSPHSIPYPPPLPPPTSLPTSVQNEIKSGSNRASKGGRRSRFSDEDDLIIIREVAAAKAHIAPNGETRERFEVATSKVNTTKRLREVVTWKTVQDRYKRLQERFDRYDWMESRMSCVGGDVGEIEELLSMMRESRADFDQKKDSKRQKAADDEEHKERLGSVIRQHATQLGAARREARKGAVILEDDDDDLPSPKEDGSTPNSRPGSCERRER